MRFGGVGAPLCGQGFVKERDIDVVAELKQKHEPVGDQLR